ncbi:MAG: SEC-C domain-containing protein, partial [Clostridiales Family XIII bacterium]|jgi:preprotein translocase subunit SecA|nr:SEC-C domain-containing protein [Clostridiales Family XIII bacterium]
VDEAVDNAVMGSKYAEEWDLDGLNAALKQISRAYVGAPYTEDQLPTLTPEILKEEIGARFIELYDKKEAEIGAKVMRDLERTILLSIIDSKWMDHIDAMDQLRHGIGLRAIGQQDPARAYAQEGFDMFELMTESIKEDTVKFCYNVTVETKTTRKQVISGGKEVKEEDAGSYSGNGGGEYEGNAGGAPARPETSDREARQETVRRTAPKTGRNEPCPCGSGKKYKNCCGKNA